MLTTEEKFEKLRQDILVINGLSYFSSSDLITLCPKCEQDRYHKNRNHGHLYISKIDPIYRCFRCDYKGFLPYLLKQLSLKFEDYFNNDILEVNWSKTSIDKFHNKEVNDNIVLVEYDKTDNYTYKENYLKSRIFNYENIDKSNIIFDIKKFLHYNNISHCISDSHMKYIDSNFVGFLCTRRSVLVCRNIDQNSNFRYYKINLKDIFFKDFYSYELNTNKTNILLCEGIFDLLNIINNEDLKEFLNNYRIISTALNNEYVNTLISTLDYVKLPYSDIVTIFSDKDVKEVDYMKMYFNNSFNKLILYYNELDKDFSSEKISLIKVPINKYIKRKPKYAKKEENIGI